ncbi:hypothetical protein [Desulfobacca acetoxidans]|uniref:Uncharacterized protein n=1 Tax=Desulfobacca acetoxidans (strain ATCC 700848 / DSM 11109 / ASRB2) TaxID=880072 RepID=F2NCD7_DESAR|nr:hypothetical protein [Desulfobacca acetoxidans]AEB09001.1 hypothetical protein Desac_1137 [Desulfobacca acetoxidans DSM 11109]
MPKIADYFTKSDRKKLFFDYLKLIGILEIVIFIVVALWATDDKYHRVYTPFPWRQYLFVAFAFPVMFTFLMGVVITGFNYFMGADDQEAEAGEAPARDRFSTILSQMRRLPYLVLLFLLLVTMLGLYNMNHIMAWVSSLGQQTFKFLSYAVAVFGALVALYLVFFMFYKYRLNKKHMQYQYYTDISNKYGLIILEDQTVLHKNGDLLVQGNRRFRRARQVGKLPPQTQLLQPQSGMDENLPMLKE